ncbi:MAG: hypothetical protein OEY59_00360 [Deltaproteobacteria bacterium]|nr:hypothetical protein [Deltaproteobacteria bacterium]
MKRFLTLDATLLSFFVLSLLVFILASEEKVTAQVNFHASVMANTDLIEGRFPGLEYTFFFGPSWGVRYSMLPTMEFKTEPLKTLSDGQLQTYSLTGEYQSLTVLRSIEHRGNRPGSKGPFEFITAYFGVGYNQINTQLVKKTFTAQSNIWSESETSEDLPTEINNFSLGLYGGESFIMLDTRFLYFTGKTDKSRLLDDKIKFKQWMILFSIGIGF